MSRTSAIARAHAYFDGGGFLSDLTRRVAIPSSSQEPDRADALRAYLLDEIVPALKRLGFDCRLLDNPSGPPVLAAERLENKTPEAAIYQACLLRFRPIMMTTAASLLGGMPLALGTGVGSEMRRPLGIAIVGGLLFSQMLTLYTTPVVYLYLDRMQLRWHRWKDRVRGTATAPAEV